MLRNSLCMEGLFLVRSWLSNGNASNFEKLETNCVLFQRHVSISPTGTCCFNDHSPAVKLT